MDANTELEYTDRQIVKDYADKMGFTIKVYGDGSTGSYCCICCHCKKTFIGYKRDVYCGVCKDAPKERVKQQLTSPIPSPDTGGAP